MAKQKTDKERQEWNRIRSGLLFLIATVALPELLRRSFALLEDHVALGLSIWFLGFLLSAVLFTDLFRRLKRNKPLRSALSIVYVITLVVTLNGWIEWALQPRATIEGSVQCPAETGASNGLEVNASSLAGDHVGRATITDGVGHFQLESLRQGMHHVLLFKVSGDAFEFTEFMTVADREERGPSTYAFPQRSIPFKRLDPILFSRASSELDFRANRAVLEIAYLLIHDERYRDQRLLIHGHCSITGSDRFNLHLGERRVQEVMKKLEELGVSADRLIPISYGKTKPAVKGESEAAHRQNRRVEVFLLPHDDSYHRLRSEARLRASRSPAEPSAVGTPTTAQAQGSAAQAQLDGTVITIVPQEKSPS